jgi:hypothetical protein
VITLAQLGKQRKVFCLAARLRSPQVAKFGRRVPLEMAFRTEPEIAQAKAWNIRLRHAEVPALSTRRLLRYFQNRRILLCRVAVGERPFYPLRHAGTFSKFPESAG